MRVYSLFTQKSLYIACATVLIGSNVFAQNIQDVDGINRTSYTGIFYIEESIKDKVKFINSTKNHGCSIDELSDYKLQLSCISGNHIYVELSNNASVYFGNPNAGKTEARYECITGHTSHGGEALSSVCPYDSKDVHPCTAPKYFDYKDPLAVGFTRSFTVKDASVCLEFLNNTF